jgi:molybdate transport system regulatory protein
MKKKAGKPGKRARGARGARAVVRGRIWVEIDSKPAITDAGADLLEQIAVCGSLSGAARRLHFSYRRAWMLLDAMNQRWPSPLATSATGGRNGGGAKLTERGQQVLRTYRDLQLQLEHLLDSSGQSFDQLD